MPIPARTDEDDAALVARARKGDARAWEAIVDRHLPMVNAIATSYRLGSPDREDAVQTVWLTLNQHLPHLHSPHHLRHWLRRVTRSLCGRQRRQIRHLQPVDPQVLAARAPGEEASSHEHDPETLYLRKELHEALHRAVGGLTDPADRRAARYYLGQAPAHETTPVERRRLKRRLHRLLREHR
ncbi:RNA polymerase sigma factor [Nocardiopsis kunsanensis]|uniref:RNA polymerase sigma-70 region 2 domain-containing protein n=1 Tax=Nocardiopsis kunsanensis TaxID=141693 RepID=A0A918XE84_9ACTN|nr:sigma-70 family RNA polymerase sigma factor [Nocardiopsis kunsanensis]GHD26862.1 hypothetical protein GCM10007147_25380 [Nocardiopsis kunsanensis]